MNNVIVLNNNSYIRKRIKELLSFSNISVHEACNSMELYSCIRKFHDNLHLLIMDINLNNEDGFEIIKQLKYKNIVIPIMILTSSNKRSTFIKGIKEGVIDYILMPFEDDALLNRILKHLDSPNDTMPCRSFTMDFNTYLSSELRKASKGKYNVSLLMCTLFKGNNEDGDTITNENLNLTDNLYDKLNPLFWETDLFIKYGPQSFIGIFPFSDENATHIIVNKISTCYDKLKLVNSEYENYLLESSFVTYPIDASTQDELIEKLSEEMNSFVNSKKNKDPSEKEEVHKDID